MRDEMDLLHYLLIAAIMIIVHGAAREIRHMRAKYWEARHELDLWRIHWGEADRWFAEFPDVVDALEHLKAKADGAGGTDIMRTREVMRARRDGIEPLYMVVHKADRVAAAARACTSAADEAAFRVRYQHLGAEVHGDD